MKSAIQLVSTTVKIKASQYMSKDPMKNLSDIRMKNKI